MKARFCKVELQIIRIYERVRRSLGHSGERSRIRSCLLQLEPRLQVKILHETFVSLEALDIHEPSEELDSHHPPNNIIMIIMGTCGYIRYLCLAAGTSKGRGTFP